MTLSISPLVYHGMPSPALGDYLLPSDNYGAVLTLEVRTALGLDMQVKPPLLFASNHISKALAFTFSRQNKEVLFNAPVKDTEFELIVLLDRRRTMASPRNGAVYSYSGQGYVPLTNLSRQLVSMSPVPLSETSKVLEIRSSLDAMKEGLQIFSMRETFDEINVKAFFKEVEEHNWSPMDTLRQLLKDGRAEWENHRQNVLPLKVLSKMLQTKT